MRVIPVVESNNAVCKELPRQCILESAKEPTAAYSSVVEVGNPVQLAVVVNDRSPEYLIQLAPQNWALNPLQAVKISC